MIDALRDIALLGVLIVNAETEFRVSIWRQFLPEAVAGSSLDHFVERLVSVAMESKAFILFSFLFGVGLAIQLERFARSGNPFVLLTRRLAVLLVFGCIHLFLIWNGDILVEYSLAGLVVLLFLRADQKILLLASAVCFLGYAVLPAFLPPDFFPGPSWIVPHVQAADRVFGLGSFLDVRRFEIAEVRSLLPLHVFVFPRTVALMLLGAVAWRSGIFARSDATSAWVALGIVGLLVWIVFFFPAAYSAFPHYVRDTVAPLIAPLGLAAFYAAAFVIVMSRRAAQGLQGWLAVVGRTAFSNYILQSLLLAALFYGWGLGLRVATGPAATLGLYVALFVLQALLSKLWLGHFRFGPIEWLWRTLIYGRVQPMKAMAAVS